MASKSAKIRRGINETKENGVYRSIMSKISKQYERNNGVMSMAKSYQRINSKVSISKAK
jgi:hypothetical protein